MPMELKYLKTFQTIVKEGSFSAAAKKLNYTQSTITFQMGQLEKETSAQLFEKSGRMMVLTDAGKLFVPYVDSVIEAVERMDYFKEEIGNCAGELRIGVAETFLCYRLPEVLKEVVTQAPKAKLIIKSMNCYEIRDALLTGELDLGIFYQDVGGNMDNLSLYPLHTYPVIMVSSPELAERIPQLTEEHQNYPVPFLINEKNCIFRQIFEQYLSDHDISLSHTIELESIETIKKLVENDVGISFLPRFAVEEELKRGLLAEIPTGITRDRITITLGYHKNKWISPLMQMAVKQITEWKFV